MATPHKGAPVQDMPPRGGYKPLNYQRFVPKPVMSGAGVFLTVGAIVGFGFFQVITGNQRKRILDAEKREARVNILPFLMAEEDVRFLRGNAKEIEYEKEIMKDVPGWVPGKSVFNNPAKWLPKTEI